MAWADTQRAAQSVYSAASREVSNAVSDVGNTYQQILRSGSLSSNSPNALNMDIADSAYQLNPEYEQMDTAYAAQEQDKAELWKGYEAWRDNQPEYQKQVDIEPER
jgi:hypothetical protein